MRWLPKMPLSIPGAGQSKPDRKSLPPLSVSRARYINSASWAMRSVTSGGGVTVFCGRPLTCWIS